MWRWALKSLVFEPLTLISSTLAVAFAFLLVILFEAIWAGEAEQIVAYIDHSDADVWVMQKGVSNMHMATSYLADWKVKEIAQLKGVEDTDSILYLNSVIQAGETRWFCFVVGLDVPHTNSGPWQVSAGNDLPARGEAVIPQTYAEMASLRLGDTVRITDRDFSVVGFSTGTFSMANSVIFITKTDLEDIMSSLDIMSYVLVRAKPGVDPEELAIRIEQDVDNVTALPRRQFLENDRAVAMQMGAEMIAVMSWIGAALATLLVAYTVYMQIARQRMQLAVTKALGASNTVLYLTSVMQGFVIVVIAVVLANAIALLITPLVSELVPQVTLKLTYQSMARIALVGLAIALAASLFPVRQLARVDPVTAFQG